MRPELVAAQALHAMLRGEKTYRIQVSSKREAKAIMEAVRVQLQAAEGKK